MNIEWGVKDILASQQKPRCDKLQLSKNSFAFHNPRRLARSFARDKFFKPGRDKEL